MSELEAKLPAEVVPGVTAEGGVDRDALIARLDALLEQYLNVVDEYEKLTQQLTKQLSSVGLAPCRLVSR